MSDTDIVKINRLYECGEGFELDDISILYSFLFITAIFDFV